MTKKTNTLALIEKDIKLIETIKEDRKRQIAIKEKGKVKEYTLQIELEDGTFWVFKLSNQLGAETMAKDLEQDLIRLKMYEKDIENRKNQLKEYKNEKTD